MNSMLIQKIGIGDQCQESFPDFGNNSYVPAFYIPQTDDNQQNFSSDISQLSFSSSSFLIDDIDENLLADLGDISDIFDSPNLHFEDTLDIQFKSANNYEDHGYSDGMIDDTNIDFFGSGQTILNSRLDSSTILLPDLEIQPDINNIFDCISTLNFPTNISVRSRHMMEFQNERFEVKTLNENDLILDERISDCNKSLAGLTEKINLACLNDDCISQDQPINKIKRKREQNKLAATKYRRKQQMVKGNFDIILSKEELRNMELKENIINAEKEINYLKNLLLEMNIPIS